MKSMKIITSPGDTQRLSNGLPIPGIGYGTYLAPDDTSGTRSILDALEAGYRLIDTASVYGNEKTVGRAVRESSIPREEIFITSKVWNNERGYQKTLNAFAKTLADLQLDYLDLYLIHWPASSSRFSNWEELNLETWRAITDLHKSGRIRAIGVSNFLPHHLAALMGTEVPPMVNQIEFHPGQMQHETVKFCRRNAILVEAWSPLGSGRLLANPLLSSIAAKYNKSVAQLCVRWCLQHEVLPLPKSVTPARIAENADVFDFSIAEDDMAAIDNMTHVGGSGLHPDHVDF